MNSMKLIVPMRSMKPRPFLLSVCGWGLAQVSENRKWVWLRLHWPCDETVNVSLDVNALGLSLPPVAMVTEFNQSPKTQMFTGNWTWTVQVKGSWHLIGWGGGDEVAQVSRESRWCTAAGRRQTEQTDKRQSSWCSSEGGVGRTSGTWTVWWVSRAKRKKKGKETFPKKQKQKQTTKGKVAKKRPWNYFL